MLFCNWGWAQQEALGGQKGIENTIFSVYDTNSTKSNEKTCSEYFCPGAFDPRWYGKEAETIHYIFSPSGSLLFTMRRDMLAGIILANFLPPKATTLYPSPPPLPSPINPPQLPSYLSSPTHNSTNLLAPSTSPSLNSAATSTFNGLSTSGHPNNILTARTHSKTLYVGVHASFNRSKQISPVSNATFACTTGVANEILGGCSGYVGGMVMRRSQRPSVSPTNCQSLLCRGGGGEKGGGKVPS